MMSQPPYLFYLVTPFVVYAVYDLDDMDYKCFDFLGKRWRSETVPAPRYMRWLARGAELVPCEEVDNAVNALLDSLNIKVRSAML